MGPRHWVRNVPSALLELWGGDCQWGRGLLGAALLSGHSPALWSLRGYLCTQGPLPLLDTEVFGGRAGFPLFTGAIHLPPPFPLPFYPGGPRGSE